MNLIWFSTKEMAMFYKFLMRALMAMILSSVGGLAWAATDKEAGADWPNLAAYRSANAQLKSAENKVEKTIFMGDSITEFWTPSFWNATRINRGISGQTTPQMLLRFRSDVIELQPQMVVILAGTNDVAGNTGPATVDMIVGTIASMAELAKVHGIRVVLCSVLPASAFPWNPGAQPADKIIEVNQRIKAYAARHQITFVDYFPSMVDQHKGLQKIYSGDGVHPNAVGYQVMANLVLQGIAEALRAPK